MDVLGIDQSLSGTGVARAVFLDNLFLERVSETVIDTNVVGTSATEWSDDLRGTAGRIRYIVGRTLRFAPAKCLTVIEAPIVMRNGKGGAQLERAWLFGLLVDQMLLRGPVVQVRTTTRAMYATDHGNADKAAVLAAMRCKFPAVHIKDDNAADALALACMGARYLGHPIDGPMSKKQKQAMTSTVWPLPEGVHA